MPLGPKDVGAALQILSPEWICSAAPVPPV